MASIENSLKYESEVEPGKIRLITSGEFVRADATERVPPVGVYTDATERVPPVGGALGGSRSASCDRFAARASPSGNPIASRRANPVATAVDGAVRVPPVGAYTDATERVPPVGANPVATAADGAVRVPTEFRI